VSIPIDAVAHRPGISQLESAGGVIVVCGTGETEASSVLRIRRRGTIHAFSDSGRPLWTVDQPESEALWFQLSASLSPDGGTLATYHSDGRDIVLQAWDGRTGERLWRRTAARRSGARHVSVAPHGRLVVLTGGDLRTFVLAWDREGTLVWDGTLPFPSGDAAVLDEHLLASDRWIVRLEPEF